MQSELLHIVTAISNPIGWTSRIKNAVDAIQSWVAEGAKVTVVECATGSRPWSLNELKGINHVSVRSRSVAWNKENLLNIGIQHLPSDAHFICTNDADIHYRKPGWAAEIVNILQLYPVIQPWADCYDLGPNDDHMQAHKSFCKLFFDDKPVYANKEKFWKFDGGPYEYAHSGFSWAWTRKVLDDIGGLMEFAATGSGDHHMALALIGQADRSMPEGTHQSYIDAVKRWESRALLHINKKISYLPATIEHSFHGAKAKRGYVSRWNMFIEHKFNPIEDLKKNSYGVVEFAGNKPDLERDFDRYLRSREEDANIF